MEDAVNRLHGEPFLYFDNEEVNGFLVTLQKINWVVAFTYQDFVLFTGEEFRKFTIGDCCTSILK